MTRITVDDSLRTRLHDLVEPLELCDSAGRVLARVTPLADSSRYEPNEPQISQEELQERARGTEWLTTSEVLAHLHSLEKS